MSPLGIVLDLVSSNPIVGAIAGALIIVGAGVWWAVRRVRRRTAASNVQGSPTRVRETRTGTIMRQASNVVEAANEWKTSREYHESYMKLIDEASKADDPAKIEAFQALNEARTELEKSRLQAKALERAPVRETDALNPSPSLPPPRQRRNGPH